jgi:hypothetical protein
MNNGFFGFPSSLDSSVIDIKEFDISGVYVVPQNTKTLIIFAVGGGGGGAGGVRLVGNGGSGGSGGNSGNFVLSQIDKKSLNGITTLNIIIGAGGSGGAGSASNGATASNGGGGGATTIGVSGKKNPFISAAGNQYGLAGSAAFGPTSQAASGVSAGISLMFGSVVFGEYGLTPGGNGAPFHAGTNTTHPILTRPFDGIGGRAGRGSTDSVAGTVHVFSPYSCGGGGGGGVSYTTVPGTAQTGGGIKFMNASSADFDAHATIYKSIFSYCLSGDYSPGDVVYSGGAINTATATINSNQMICPDCMFSAGFGGAGGGGGASTSANNGANGYRGGGGGGGGGSKNVAAGTGGTGGNGYVKIIAIG